MGHHHPITLRSEQRDNIHVAVNVVGPAMQKNHRWAAGGPGLDVTDVQLTGIDLLQRAEWWGGLIIPGNCVCGTRHVPAPTCRSERNAARISVEKRSGCSQAAKWPPRSSRL